MAVKDLERHVAQFLQRYSTPGECLGVAVSGGADSTVLLHLLANLLPRSHLHVLHVNHCLRGGESDADQEFVAALARTLGLALHAFSGPPAPGNMEAQARRARYQFFKTAREQYGLGAIATGHTASDQAETVLFRILRGTGPAGLGGMPPRDARGILRPLLQATRQEVRAYAGAQGIPFREDSTNHDLRFRRNRLRCETLPLLARQFNPQLESALNHLAEIARDQEADRRREVRRILARRLQRAAIGGWQLDIHRFERFSISVQRLLLRQVLARVSPNLPSIDFAHVEQVRALAMGAEGHARAQLPGVDVLRSFHQLLVAAPDVLRSPRDYEFALGAELTTEQTLELPYGAGSVRLRTAIEGNRFCDTVKNEGVYASRSGLIDATALRLHFRSAPLILRNWRPGDSISVAGEKAAVKIKSLFQHYRIPLWERRHWPLLLAGDTVIWARTFGVAPAVAVSGTAGEVVQVEWRAL